MKPNLATLVFGIVAVATTNFAFAQGKQPIFNGKDFSGWHNYNSAGVTSIWRVDSGAIVLTGTNGGDLVTDADYENFELEWEWKIASGGNSGVFYLVDERKDFATLDMTGAEYQIADNEQFKTKNLPKYHTGSCDGLYAPEVDATLPIGQWNKSKLRLRNGQVQHFLNGKLVLSYTLWTDQWKADVASSKLRTKPAYGLANKGKIGLQDHGDRVWYRNLYVTRL